MAGISVVNKRSTFAGHAKNSSAMTALQGVSIGSQCLRTDDLTASSVGTFYELVSGTGANTTDWVAVVEITGVIVSVPGANTYTIEI